MWTAIKSVEEEEEEEGCRIFSAESGEHHGKLDQNGSERQADKPQELGAASSGCHLG